MTEISTWKKACAHISVNTVTGRNHVPISILSVSEEGENFFFINHILRLS